MILYCFGNNKINNGCVSRKITKKNLPRQVFFERLYIFVVFFFIFILWVFPVVLLFIFDLCVVSETVFTGVDADTVPKPIAAKAIIQIVFFINFTNLSL